jgi:hypothetical protein
MNGPLRSRGVRSDALGGLEDANLPPVLPVTALRKDNTPRIYPVPPVNQPTSTSTWGTGGKTKQIGLHLIIWEALVAMTP